MTPIRWRHCGSARPKSSKLKANRPVFVLQLQHLPGVDPIRSLRAVLKWLLRRHGLRVLSIQEQHAPHARADGPAIKNAHGRNRQPSSGSARYIYGTRRRNAANETQI
jgi:hypothetical protein